LRISEQRGHDDIKIERTENKVTIDLNKACIWYATYIRACHYYAQSM